MTDKSLPMGGGWAAQQKEGLEKQAKLQKDKRVAKPPRQDDVVDQQALVADEERKDKSARPEN